MYESRKGSKMTRLRGVDEYLSCEQAVPRDEEAKMGEARGERAQTTRAREERAAGKQAIPEGGLSSPSKRDRRQLSVESPTSKAQQGAKLLQDAFKFAPIMHIEEEEEESSVAGISHQVGLRSTGLALVGAASSYHPMDDEDESTAGDAESAGFHHEQMMEPFDMIALGQTSHEEAAPKTPQVREVVPTESKPMVAGLDDL